MERFLGYDGLARRFFCVSGRLSAINCWIEHGEGVERRRLFSSMASFNGRCGCGKLGVGGVDHPELIGSSTVSAGAEVMKARLLSACVVIGIAGNAYAQDNALALIREWRASEMACRGNNDPAACAMRDSVAQELGQMGWCFKGYSYDRQWRRC